ncbi:ATP synthase F1 subunit delta [Myxococcota bacterium]|nr:ATP synthase F1 subunit delta [Myxococcota bacterium]MBU1382560.1 ATP synthase F1 subunit delta [Myxococcota bacterium]MBU1496083.1 ATP synthase F1 subunit delta [Myxococcota bacterium]
MNGDLIASRYARAVFDCCNGDVRTITRVAREFSLIENNWKLGLEEIFTNPVFKPSERKRVIESYITEYNFLNLTADFIRLLSDRSRFINFLDISRKFKALMDDLVERIIVTVISARDISPALLTEYRREVELQLGHSAIIHQVIDPDLVGGIKIIVKNRMFDGSVTGQLRRIGNKLGLPRSA